MLLSKALRM
jgi:predicted nuclease with TOPRIM domain